MIPPGSSPRRSRANWRCLNHGPRSRPTVKRVGSSAAALSHSATRSRAAAPPPSTLSAPRATTIWPMTRGNKSAACRQPMRSRYSNALFMKSSECPLSAKTRSVSVTNSKSARAHLPTAHFGWAGRHVIRPEIERAADRKIEPGMVPVAGQNAVLHASAIEGEPHMRASVVKGINATLVIDDQDGVDEIPVLRAALWH